MKKSKKVIVISLVIGVIAVGFGAKKGLEIYTSEKEFKTLVQNGNGLLKEEKYSEAIEIFEKAMKIKEDPEIKKAIKLAKQDLEEEKLLNEVAKLESEEKIEEAMNLLKNSNDSEKLQARLGELKTKQIDNLMKSYNESYKKKDYKAAIAVLDNISKIDPDNKEVKGLKEKCNVEIEKNKMISADEAMAKITNYGKGEMYYVYAPNPTYLPANVRNNYYIFEPYIAEIDEPAGDVLNGVNKYTGDIVSIGVDGSIY